MRKFSAFIFAFFLSALIFAQEIKFLSFNMASRNKTAIEVADMIKEAGADFVFLQEIWVSAPKDDALVKMCTRLGKSEWDFVSSSAYSLQTIQTIGNETYKTGGNGQNNAILYNKSKISLKNLANELEFSHFGKTETNFLFDKNNVVAVEFFPKDFPQKKCVAIDIHLPYSDKAHRKRDLETLERLYAHYKFKYAVLVAGDFNYNRKDLTKRNFDIVDGTEKWFYDPNFGICTTLSTKGEEQVIFANDYDHFIFNKKFSIKEQMHRAFSDSVEMRAESIQFGSQVYSNSVSFRKTISDHVPIEITLEINE